MKSDYYIALNEQIDKELATTMQQTDAAEGIWVAQLYARLETEVAKDDPRYREPKELAELARKAVRILLTDQVRSLWREYKETGLMNPLLWGEELEAQRRSQATQATPSKPPVPEPVKPVTQVKLVVNENTIDD